MRDLLLALVAAVAFLQSAAPELLFLLPARPACRMACAGTAHCCCRPAAGGAARQVSRPSSHQTVQASSLTRRCPPGCAAAAPGNGPMPAPPVTAAVHLPAPAPPDAGRPAECITARDLLAARPTLPRAPPQGSLIA